VNVESLAERDRTRQSDLFPWNEGNRNRWPNNHGTINLIDEAVVLRAAGEIKTGQVISCAQPLRQGTPAYYANAAKYAYTHEMITAWKGHAPGDIQVSGDQFSMQPHGTGTTHVDALCHFGFEGKGFNGAAFTDIVTMDGVKKFDVTDIGTIVTRGIFVDAARKRELEVAQPGDALFIRTGHVRARELGVESEYDTDSQGHKPSSGLHPDCLKLIQDKDIAVLGTDASGDNFPPVLDYNPRPVHIFTLVYLGIPLLHHLGLEDLGKHCSEVGRSTFMLTIAPLNMPGGTASPVTPVAVF
jgi:kynurenine formamidase